MEMIKIRELFNTKLTETQQLNSGYINDIYSVLEILFTSDTIKKLRVYNTATLFTLDEIQLNIVDNQINYQIRLPVNEIQDMKDLISIFFSFKEDKYGFQNRVIRFYCLGMVGRKCTSVGKLVYKCQETYGILSTITPHTRGCLAWGKYLKHFFN